MLKRLLIVFFCINCLFAFSGCGNKEFAPEDENDSITVRVFNNTDDVYISWAVFFGGTFDEWGKDLLDDEVIEPGQTFEFVLPAPEEGYGLSLFTYEFYVVHNDWDIKGDREIVIGGDGKVPMLFVNKSPVNIAFLYISPPGSSDWGEDWLGENDGILAETGGRLFFLEPGVYDILALSEDEEALVDERDLEIDFGKNRVLTYGE